MYLDEYKLSLTESRTVIQFFEYDLFTKYLITVQHLKLHMAYKKGQFDVVKLMINNQFKTLKLQKIGLEEIEKH